MNDKEVISFLSCLLFILVCQEEGVSNFVTSLGI